MKRARTRPRSRPALLRLLVAAAAGHREAVVQAVAAGALQRNLTAAWRDAVLRRSGEMRGIPRPGGFVVAQAQAVVMAKHGRARAARRPVAAGRVAAVADRAAVGCRAGQHVVRVGRVAPAVDHFAFLAERGLLVEVVPAVQLIDVARDDHAPRVLPRAPADAVAGVNPGRAEVGVPGLAAGSHRLGERLAVLVGPRETAQVGALARARTG